MPKVAVVTDSISCLTRELVNQYGMGIIPINFYAGGKVYKDWVDITPSEAYELFLKDPESFKTAATSPEDCLKAYRQASKLAETILFITVSTKLSAVYEVAKRTKEQLKSELPRIHIEVFDSRTATAAEGLVALAAARLAAEGKELAEVIAAAEKVRDRVNMVVLLDTMRHVYRSGRVPKIASQAASILNIRPILTISPNSGVVRFTSAVRSRQHGVSRLLEIMRGKVAQRPVHVAVMHAYALDRAEKLMEQLSTRFNCTELWLSEFSPIMGYATGTGTLGLAFYADD